MPEPETAVKLFDEGWSCAESTFRAMTEGQPDAGPWIRAAATFGAGIAWQGHVCGAVTGCAMAIGVLTGRAELDDQAAKARSYAIVASLIQKMEARFGTIQCAALTGLDFRLPEHRARYQEDVHGRVCVPLVRAAVEITLEELASAG